MSDIHSWIDAYVVWAVTPEEAHQFEAHLPNCAACSAELAELRSVTARLSQVVATEPPPSLRDGILAAISATPQESATAQGATTDGRHLAAVPASTEVRVQEATPERPDQPSRRWSSLLIAAAVLAAIGLGGWALQSRDRANDLTLANEQVVRQNQEFTELLSAEDVRAVSGRFTEGGSGAVVMSRSKGKAILVASDLPDLPADKVYEAWTIKGDPVPAGLFSAADSSSVLELPDAAFDAKSVAVTIEPAGGSDRPTSEPVFTVSVPQR